MIIRLIRYLKQIKPLYFICIGVCAILIVSIIFGLIFPGNSIKNTILNNNKYIVFISAVLFAPLLETIIFQAGPFYIVNRYVKLKKKRYIFIFVTPILFIHHYSIVYAVITYLVGIILAFMYYVSHYRKENSIILIALIHFINNLIAFFIYHL